MITPFALDPDVVSGYKTAQAVRSVMHRMGGLNNKSDFAYHGRTSSGGITEHRIREIQELGDLGTTYTNGPSYFQRHASEAVNALDSHLGQWDFIAKYLGREDVFKRVEGFINRSHERILPACFAINEADINDRVQKSYQEMCDHWIGQCRIRRQIYHGEKQVAAQSLKRVLRQAEIAAAKEILEGFRGDLSAWVEEIRAQIQ